jgi:hypothetical protein
MFEKLPYRSINNGNIFARSEKISEIFEKKSQNFCIVTKEENIKKYSLILKSTNIPVTTLTTIHDICDMLDQKN